MIKLNYVTYFVFKKIIRNTFCTEYWPEYSMEHGQKTYCQAYLWRHPPTTTTTTRAPWTNSSGDIEDGISYGILVLFGIVFIIVVCICGCFKGSHGETATTDQVQQINTTER